MVDDRQILIWVGAGSASYPIVEWEQYEEIYLVEAQLELCNKLTRKYENNDRINVVNLCVAHDQNEVKSHFHLQSLRDYSALSLPTGLRTLFPSLVQTKSIEIKTETIIELCSKIPSFQQAALILDLPDLAGALLNDLCTANILHKFTRINVSCGKGQLYENAHTLVEIEKIMHSQFFKIVEIDNADPDIPLIDFQFDESASHIASLENTCESLQSKLLEEQEKYTSIIAANSELKKQNKLLNTRLASLTNEVEQTQLMLTAENEELKQKEQLATSKLDSISIEKEQLELRNSQLSKELDDLNGRLVQITNSANESEQVVKKIQAEMGIELKKKTALGAGILLLREKINASNDESDEQVLAACHTHISKLQEVANANEQEISELKVVVAEAEKNIESLQSKLEDNKANRVELNEYCKMLKGKLSSSEQESKEKSALQSRTIDLLTKQNMKLQIDLDDLRAKYEARLQSESALRSLIGELHDKLQQAANFYRKLESSNPELLGGNSD